MYFLTVDLIEKNYKNIIKKTTAWIDAQIGASKEAGTWAVLHGGYPADQGALPQGEP